MTETACMQHTIFDTERLRCRRWIAADFNAVLAVYSDAEAMRWVGDGRPITPSQCEEWFRVTEANYLKREYGMFAVEERGSDAVIGFCGLVHPGGQPEAEIKYAFRRAHWGRGFAAEAVRAMLAHGHAVHGLARIIATVAPDNLASQRVLMKAGMRLQHARIGEGGTPSHVHEWLAG